MPAFLVSIRISGDVRGSDIARQAGSQLSTLQEKIQSLPGVEAVEYFMSQEQPSADIDHYLLNGKPRINYGRALLSPALNGHVRAELGRQGFTTLNQLSWMSRRELGYIVGVGHKSLDTIEVALRKNGLELLPDNVALNQRDWKFLPVGALRLLRILPESAFPHPLNRQLELGRYLSFSDERLAGMLGDHYRDQVPSPYSDEVRQHREFIERVRAFVS